MSGNHDIHAPAFARGRTAGISNTTELRGDCPSHIVAALDALALARGMNRTAYVNVVLGAHVEEEVTRASVLVRTLRGNPLLPDDIGGSAE